MTDVLPGIEDPELVNGFPGPPPETPADPFGGSAGVRPAPESLGTTVVRVLKRTGLWYLLFFLFLGLRKMVRARPTAAASVGTALTILGTFLLGFVADTAVVGRIRHDRDRQNQYAHFRYALADGTAPLGSLDGDGKPVPPGTPVAFLRIPDLGVHEVVEYGTTSSILMSGPGLRRDTVLPGQAGTSVIMGRRALYGAPFRAIDQLHAGESIVVTTGQGESTYQVVDVRHAGDKVPAQVVSAPSVLVLTTADGTAYVPRDVLRVDAVLISPKQAMPAGPVAGAATDDRPLSGEGEAWIPLVLWGQALLVAAVGVTWLRARWGGRQAWLVGAPVLAALGLAAADTFARLLPNVM